MSSVVSLRLALSNPTLPEITDGYEIQLHHSMGHDQIDSDYPASPALVLTACSHPEPLPTSTVAPVVPITDQTVIAETVGRATVGSDPLAWANPSTGSAGVIEQVRPGANPNGCRDFVTSKQSLESVTRFNGVACPADGSWKINGSSGLL
ncbi:RT0821/Lpp0805 family surface protein [Rhizobium sp. BK226]|uniref:RT0821/Lpp0805 family surface protein n=1 Tax=Rhizobium sp. BK226 TaxID=2587075 RepID=UPI0028B0BCB8|nr:RT0821/Lpp0805 family surface protein [Rhizobium sp. BK226]